MLAYPKQILIEPLDGPFEVLIRPPGSKSLTNRALLLAALAEGASTLTNVLFADDTRVMMRALQQLGFNLEIDEANMAVTVHGQAGRIPSNSAELHLGNSGTSVRFLTAACCLGDPASQYVIDGIPRMRRRPIDGLIDPLRQMGATIEYLAEPGYPPIRIHGGGLDGSALSLGPMLSSQFVSAMLMVAPFCRHLLDLRFDGPINSLPYIIMTLDLMEWFGAPIAQRTMGPRFQLTPGKYQALALAVEPDASNASYFLASAALIPKATCRVKGLGTDSLQGDTAFAASILRSMGALVRVGTEEIEVTGSQLNGIDRSLNDIPDMALTLGTLAVLAHGPTTIRDVGNLRVKETDRISALKIELEKLGADVSVDEDDLHIGPPPDGRIPPGVSINTYDDHRIAMSFSILGLIPGGAGLTINDPSCVAKTYPRFFDDLQLLRASTQAST